MKNKLGEKRRVKNTQLCQHDTQREKLLHTHARTHTHAHTHVRSGFSELQANLIASVKSFVARAEFVKKF